MLFFFFTFKERNPFLFSFYTSSAQIVDTLVAEASGSTAKSDKYRKLIESVVLEVKCVLLVCNV